MYVIIGAGGFLGGYVLQAILEKTTDMVIATARTTVGHMDSERVAWIELNIQSEQSTKKFISTIEKYQSVKIIYLAAYHHPELVEKNKQLAWDINVTALSRFVNATYFADSLYYASTDCVYGNSVNGYHFKENDPCHPVNFYGHNKCAAEAIVIHAGRNVVRFPFLISPSLVNKKHFYDEIVDQVKRGQPVEMFNDSYRSSLGFDRAAELWIELINQHDAHPIINICGDKDLSKYDVGLMIAEREHIDTSLIVPTLSNQSAVWIQTTRARSTLMDNSLLKKILKLKTIDIFDKPERIESQG